MIDSKSCIPRDWEKKFKDYVLSKFCFTMHNIKHYGPNELWIRPICFVIPKQQNQSDYRTKLT